jgi:2-polyprenyl-3-methyl-5-hydroxy-6-metoxy-1,4-benzoquinol methylase
VDAETYEPTEKFDAIIFNETLYYFHEPLVVMARYVQALRPNGIILVSTYGRSARALAILRALKASYPLLDEAQARHAGTVWVCSVFTP